MALLHFPWKHDSPVQRGRITLHNEAFQKDILRSAHSLAERQPEKAVVDGDGAVVVDVEEEEEEADVVVVVLVVVSIGVVTLVVILTHLLYGREYK